MYCKNCGNEINKNAKYCNYCGKELNTKSEFDKIKKQQTDNLSNDKKIAKSFYIIDFFKNIVKKNNTGVIIWMIINSVLVTFFIGYILTMSSYTMLEHPVIAYLIGFVVYIASISVAISPIGEFILRIKSNCKEITRKDYLDRLNPIFEEVYQKAKKENNSLYDDIKFFISDDEEPNAFATGRKTICITEGLLQYSDEEIKAVIGHEFGHLAHKDTDAILVVEVGNIIVTVIFFAFRLLIKLVTFIFHLIFSIVSDDFADIFVSALSRIFIDIVLVTVMNIWRKIGILICLHSSRKNEFLADEYCCLLGYGHSLCEVLDNLDGKNRHKTTLWATLNSTHPNTNDRIAHMQNLGVEYSKNEKASKNANQL